MGVGTPVYAVAEKSDADTVATAYTWTLTNPPAPGKISVLPAAVLSSTDSAETMFIPHIPGRYAVDSDEFEVARQMWDHITSLISKRDSAAVLIEQVEHAGIELAQAEFALNDVSAAITKARVTVHGISLEAMFAVTNPGDSLAALALDLGRGGLAELASRRSNFLILLGIILIVGVALYFKIKEVDERREEAYVKTDQTVRDGHTVGRPVV